ncbi:MAG: leucine-rich repeat domain-containing protein [Bacilli bacterium]|nr:leucine-rich repeat domain-containing protein [Bacilli bacterium]
MSKSIKILLILLLSMLMLGCGNQSPSNEEYIDIEKLYSENKELIEKVVSHADIKAASEKFDFEYSSDIYLEGKFSVMRLKKIDGVKINFEKILYYQSRHFVILMCEMKNEKSAKEVYEKYKLIDPEYQVFYEKNVIYFNEIIFNLVKNNYFVEGDNYITSDNKTFLTNLSDDETLQIPNVVEIAKEACLFFTNIKSLYMNESLEKIKYGAFYGCFNLQNVYLNDGLKEIDDYSFYACESLKYVVIPESVEKIGKKVFSHGFIFCEAESKPANWDESFYGARAKVYWGNEWKYNEDGVPMVINIGKK